MPTTSQPTQSSNSHYRQLALLLTLYFAQGLPAGFVTQALPAILRQYNVSLVAIGWSGLILVPWGIKFLWAPFVDRHFLPTWGRSRSWILPLQIVSIIVLVGVAWFNPHNLSDSHAILTLYAMLLGLSVIGATHDVATDGLATRLLKTDKSDRLPQGTNLSQESILANDSQSQHKQGQGNAVQVVGYRGGLIIGGGVLLMLLDKLGWRMSFLLMAGLVFVNTIPILCYREPKQFNQILSNPSAQTPSHFQQFSLKKIKNYIYHHYQYFWSSREMQAWLAVLVTYKIADGISSGMVKPMMVDMGIKLEQIGFWATVLGSGSSILGAWVASILIKRLSRFQALLGFNALQSIITGLYGLVIYAFSQHWIASFDWFFAINALEHFCASLALVAMLTTIMHYARHEQAGSDFTVQVCVMTALGGSSHFLSGYMAHWLGYTAHFTLSMLIGIVFLLPIIVWHKLKSD